MILTVQIRGAPLTTVTVSPTSCSMISDTDDAARHVQIAAARRLTPSQRVGLSVEMSEDARQISIESEQRRHPGLTQAQARLNVLRRLWGAALTAAVIGSGTPNP